MIEGLVIRPAVLGDELTLQANCKTAATVEQVRQQVEYTTRYSEAGIMAHLVADLDGEVIGNAMLIGDTVHPIVHPDRIELCRGRTDRPRVEGRFDDWVVYGKYWRRGVGRALFNAAETMAREWGWKSLATSTRLGSNAELAFRTYGLKEWGRFPRGGENIEVFFYKLLTDHDQQT